MSTAFLRGRCDVGNADLVDNMQMWDRPLPHSAHGVVSAAQLITAGWSRPEIRKATDLLHLTRLRPGWYAGPDADQAVGAAVKAGGHLSCVSALARHGLWVPPDDHLVHTRLTDHIGQQAAPAGVRFCRAYGPDRFRPARDAVDPLGPALLTAARCATPELFVAILDSATHRRGFDADDLRLLLSGAPGFALTLVDRCDEAESGTESLVRFRLRSRQVGLTPQVMIGTVGRVDFLVGRRFVIEVDSVAHHTSTPAYRRDRRRDRRLAALGYVVVRLTYEEVMYEWDDVLPDLLAIIRSGAHLKPPKPGTGIVVAH